MKSVVAYIRVSTTKQGELGSSLQEQRAAIEAYAQRHDLTILEWYEEIETAAKLGRQVFNRMLSEIGRKRAAGVIVHKIDRSARNLKDWARIGELIDQGFELHLAHESLDLATRGGRLAADIQAVVAADYIRNLSQETRKGMYGRLKQGFYPLPAPRGYLNRGKARRKEIDPVDGPLVRTAFELYATQAFSLDSLRAEMARRGLHQRSGRPLSREGMSTILNNPFYFGVMRLKSTSELFQGNHETLITHALFDRVHAILVGKTAKATNAYDFLFRRRLACAGCSRSLIGERQKGHVYYRCHSENCVGISLREEVIADAFVGAVSPLSLTDRELGDVRDMLQALRAEDVSFERDRLKHIERDRAKLDERHGLLTDALLDGTLDRDAYLAKKNQLTLERARLDELARSAKQGSDWEALLEKLELGFVAQQQYETGEIAEKRETVDSIVSNFTIYGKEPVITLLSPFAEWVKWANFQNGAPRPDGLRTRADIRQLITTLKDAMPNENSDLHEESPGCRLPRCKNENNNQGSG